MKKWIYIGLSFLILFLVLILGYCNRPKDLIIKDEVPVSKVKTIDYAKKVVLDSIALERMQDSIAILNNMIANNVQKVKYIKIKSNEKINNVSKWSSAQYNEFLTDRYKDRK